MNQSEKIPVPTRPLPENPSYAMGYVPYQINPEIYSADEALEKGTLYPELFKPFIGKRGVYR